MPSPIETLPICVARWRTLLGDVERRGVAVEGSRFLSYLELFDRLVVLEQAKDSDRYSAFRADETNLRVMYEGASQFQQLTLASRVWHDLEPDVLTRKLRTILRGTVLPNDRGREDGPRDALVELLAAAIFADYGFKPTITDNDADLVLEGHGLGRVVAECKRPTSLGSAISKSRRQLQKRTAGGQHLGVAVFALECAFDLPFRRWSARSEQEVHDGAQKMIEQACKVANALERKGPSYRLRRLAPIAIFVVSGALFLDAEPTATVYSFTHLQARPTGRIEDVPPALDRALLAAASGGILSEFRVQ
jgi:hypothetical protein